MFDLTAIAGQFDMPGTFVAASPLGAGHINDTFAVDVKADGKIACFVMQRINHKVFKDPVSLMSNVVRVTNHQRVKLYEHGVSNPDRRALTLVPTKNAMPFYRDNAGNTWRVYYFINDAKAYDMLEAPSQAYEAARAYGTFQRFLVDLPGERLHETVPNFHNTVLRFAALEAAMEKDPKNRAVEVRDLIDFAMERKKMTGVLLGEYAKGNMPERITHNDTKINNVMLDNETSEWVCVIDLDTVMPGLALYDFGDLVRSATNSSDEAQKDLSKVYMKMDVFEAAAKGYIETAGSFLTKSEKEHLTFSVKLMTFEVGIRFLTDYILGDVYFKIRRPEHNADRCKVQFKMVRCMEANESLMNKIVERYLREYAFP